MQFRIAKESLAAGLASVARVISTRTTLPILSTLRIEAAEEGTLRLTGTDLDVTLEVTLNAVVQKPGATGLLASKITSITKSLGDVDLVFEEKKAGRIGVTAACSAFVLTAFQAEEFPPTTVKRDDMVTTSIAQARLAEMLDLVRFCVSTDESRYVLNGVCFEFKGGLLRTVATDGRRLATVSQPCALQTEHSFILPRKAVELLLPLLGEEGEATVSFNDRCVTITAGNAVLTSKLIEGSYPNWRQVLPEQTATVELDRGALLGACRRALIMASLKDGAGDLRFEGSTLAVDSSADAGEAHETLLTPRREDLSIRFNLEYLTDALNAVGGESIHFAAADPLSPGVLTAPAKNWQYVVMPMRKA